MISSVEQLTNKLISHLSLISVFFLFYQISLSLSRSLSLFNFSGYRLVWKSLLDRQTSTLQTPQQCPVTKERKAKVAVVEKNKSPTKLWLGNTPLISINDYTECKVLCSFGLNIHLVSFCRAFKKRAPRAVKELKKFAEKMMKTPDVRIDSKLNKEIWSQGIKFVLFLSVLSLLHCPF